MDTLTFFASIIGALAWPGAVVLLVLLLRKPISEVIPLLQKMKYKDIELEFGRKLEAVTEEAIEVLPVAPTRDQLPPPKQEAILRLAEISPRSAILEAWIEVESAAIEAANRAMIEVPNSAMVAPKVMGKLLEARLVNIEQYNLVAQLRKLRNHAAHMPNFSLATSDAVEYSKLALQLAAFLRTIIPAQGQ